MLVRISPSSSSIYYSSLRVTANSPHDRCTGLKSKCMVALCVILLCLYSLEGAVSTEEAVSDQNQEILVYFTQRSRLVQSGCIGLEQRVSRRGHAYGMDSGNSSQLVCAINRQAGASLIAWAADRRDCSSMPRRKVITMGLRQCRPWMYLSQRTQRTFKRKWRNMYSVVVRRYVCISPTN